MTSTISAFHNFRIDMFNPNSMGSGTMVGLPSVSPDKVTWVTVDGRYDLYGSGFSANPFTGTLTGTAHRVDYSEGGRVVASADGMNLGAADVLKISQSYDMVRALIETLLPGDNIFKLDGGNDIVRVGAGTDIVHGGGGTDTVLFEGGRSSYSITKNGDGSLVVSRPGDVTTLFGVERAAFADGVLAFDTDGVAGQAYRLYQAAFDRTPDAGGLAHWIKSLDGDWSLGKVAGAFIASAEFTSAYGSLTDFAFVGQLYINILGREAEAGGLNFWSGKLASGEMSRADVLVGLSESGENVSLVGSAIEAGVWY